MLEPPAKLGELLGGLRCTREVRQLARLAGKLGRITHAFDDAERERVGQQLAHEVGGFLFAGHVGTGTVRECARTRWKSARVAIDDRRRWCTLDDSRRFPRGIGPGTDETTQPRVKE